MMLCSTPLSFVSSRSTSNNNNNNDDNDDNVKTAAMMTELQLPKSRRADFYRELKEDQHNVGNEEAKKTIDVEVDEKAPIYIVSFHEEKVMNKKRK